ncbi:DUF2782 domain-containing protein [Thiohalomonas denitrificans]|uniref:DUF2782 domain-containing protein n=1 Tax=Thiohalomonas denitrificans TaxID=415747 RepID=A0A1G5QSL0_9GAMM|nr:DUF2782 domain-containing protein [Thiohalomonas denitrificans]SCZ64558.1 Protein of unknown function [Thiohalomonas denitrificans]
MRTPAVILALALLTPAAAQEPPGGETEPPPPIPENLPMPEGLEPEVRIQRRGEDVIEQYSVGGQVYMVKITPTAGAPYYLIDTDGDGRLETFRNDLENPPIVQWRLFEW